MFAGHGLIAFTIATWGAVQFGVPRSRAISLGVFAALFAWVPDVDIVYAPIGLILRSAPAITPDVFWETANVIHRGLTHSLVFAVVLTVVAALWVTDTRFTRLTAVSMAAGVAVVSGAVSGGTAGLIAGVFAGCSVGVTELARRWEYGVIPVAGAAFIGLVSHPFGDLLTGAPPDFLYPFDAVFIANRIALHSDPTVHVLLAFLIEIGTVWGAVWTYTQLNGESLQRAIHPSATLGAVYAVMVVVLPAPTLENASLFVFTILPVGLVSVPAQLARKRVQLLEVVATALAAVTVAAIAYGVSYGLV